jgi:hypothetical protein
MNLHMLHLPIVYEEKEGENCEDDSNRWYGRTPRERYGKQAWYIISKN